MRRILFPTDFSPCAERALAHALFHADTQNAELHILHAVHWDAPSSTGTMPDPETILHEMHQVARVRIAEMLSSRGEQTFHIVTRTEIGPRPAAVINQYITDHHICMTVMGTHGRSLIPHFLLGSVAEEVARTAHCPVMTVRADGAHNRLGALRHILVPIDYSNQAKHALYHARQIAEMHGSMVHLLHVIPDIEPACGHADAGFELLDTMMPRLVEEHRERLGAFLEQTGGARVPYDVEVATGKVHWQTVAIAEKHHMDMIVMGTHGYKGFNHLLLGSNAERVIRTAPCPVFTVKINNI